MRISQIFLPSLLALLIFCCSQVKEGSSTDIENHSFSADSSQVKTNLQKGLKNQKNDLLNFERIFEDTIVNPIELIDLTFRLGDISYIKEECSFLFECDCCSGDITLLSDKSFEYVDYCISDMTSRTGTYSLKDSLLELNFNELSHFKIYNEEHEFDSMAQEYFVIDTMLAPIKLKLITTKCNDQLVVESPEYGVHGIEVFND